MDRGNGLEVDYFGGGLASAQQKAAAEAHTLAQIKGPGGLRGQRVLAGFVQGRRSGAKVVSGLVTRGSARGPFAEQDA